MPITTTIPISALSVDANISLADNLIVSQYGTNLTFQASVGSVINNITGWFNVKTYGAKGDGVTDDWAKIMVCANAAGPGGYIFFPAGVYRISQPIIPPYPGQYYIGSGRTSAEYPTSGGTIITIIPAIDLIMTNAFVSKGIFDYLPTPASGHDITVPQTDNTTIMNMTLDAQARNFGTLTTPLSASTSYPFPLSGVLISQQGYMACTRSGDNWILDNVHFYDGHNFHLFLGGNSTIVRNCEFSGGDGYQDVISGGGNYHHIHHNIWAANVSYNGFIINGVQQPGSQAYGGTSGDRNGIDQEGNLSRFRQYGVPIGVNPFTGVGTPVNITQNITGSSTPQNVSVNTTANFNVGAQVTVGNITYNSSGVASGGELVYILGFTPNTSLSAIFLQNHNSGENVTAIYNGEGSPPIGTMINDNVIQGKVIFVIESCKDFIVKNNIFLNDGGITMQSNGLYGYNTFDQCERILIQGNKFLSPDGLKGPFIFLSFGQPYPAQYANRVGTISPNTGPVTKGGHIQICDNSFYNAYNTAILVGGEVGPSVSYGGISIYDNAFFDCNAVGGVQITSGGYGWYSTATCACINIMSGYVDTKIYGNTFTDTRSPAQMQVGICIGQTTPIAPTGTIRVQDNSVFGELFNASNMILAQNITYQALPAGISNLPDLRDNIGWPAGGYSGGYPGATVATTLTAPITGTGSQFIQVANINGLTPGGLVLLSGANSEYVTTTSVIGSGFYAATAYTHTAGISATGAGLVNGVAIRNYSGRKVDININTNGATFNYIQVEGITLWQGTINSGLISFTLLPGQKFLPSFSGGPPSILWFIEP